MGGRWRILHAGMPAAKRTQAPPRIRIRPLSPVIDAGRYAPKRCVGDAVTVAADVFSDGHEKLRAVVRYRSPGGRNWLESEMRAIDAHHNGVRWEGTFSVELPGSWEYSVEAWIDLFATWRDEISRKIAAAQDDLSGELSEGAVLVERALAKAKGADRETLSRALAILRDESAADQGRYDAALSPELDEAMERVQGRHGVTRMDKALPLAVDRVRARFGSWYEVFPRSWGGLKGVEALVPELSEMGFDVVYMTPIHPIGVTNRKGRNNTLVAGKGDPGSPYAVGGKEGGHDAVHPELGTVDDVRSLCATAREHGMDVCMDFAINASADHPWLTEHPEWFHRRPDGTLKYAENPPKKYQDIYNVNWECEDWRGLWDEWLRIFLFWVDAGVKVYRVDNPHTKPFLFWEWLIAEVHKVDRDVIFLAEAFTRRAVMRELAKLGFTQSYTYFTWKTSRYELTEYVNELAHTEEREYFRPNFFPVTPDILEAYLVHGGPGAFFARLILAGTLSPVLRHLLGLRALRERAGARGLGGVPQLREVRDLGAQARRPAAPRDPAAERDPPREPRAPADRQRPLPRDPQRRAHRLCQAHPRQHRHRRREPRSVRGPGGLGGDPGRARPRARVRGRGPAHRRALRLAPRRQLRAHGGRAAPGARAAGGRMTPLRQRSRALVRGLAAVVQDRGLLRDPHARVLRRQRRRLR